MAVMQTDHVHTSRWKAIAMVGATAMVVAGCNGGDGDDAALEIISDADGIISDGDGSDISDISGDSDAATSDDDAFADELDWEPGDVLGSGTGVAVLAGVVHEFDIVCNRASADGGAVISGVGAAGPMNAMFGLDESPDSMSLAIDGGSWRADTDGTRGLITSVGWDANAGVARGDAAFESASGETATGTFEFVCANWS